MSGKQAILGRIREALAHPSHPEVHTLAGNGERILVLGAHGPKRLTVLLIG